MPIPIPIAAPSAVPPPPPGRPEPIHLQHSWVGWDGSVWDLCSPDSGVSLGAGVRGLTMPPTDRFTSSSPALAGSRWRGARTAERPVFWPLRVYTPDLPGWYAYDAAFWRTMRPTKTGTWTVTNPVTGTVRRLECRFVDDSDHAVTTDPGLTGWMFYGLNLVAEQPYWAGELVTRSFANEPPVPFYASEHVSPDPGSLFYISSGSTLAMAAIDNPGDVDAYPIFVLDGPWEAGASAGIGSDGTVYAGSIAAGKSVVIDTRPDRLGAKQIDTPTADVGSDAWLAAVEADGVDVFTSLSSLASSVVPSGEDAPLAISATGQGSVHVAVLPLYERAW